MPIFFHKYGNSDLDLGTTSCSEANQCKFKKTHQKTILTSIVFFFFFFSNPGMFYVVNKQQNMGIKFFKKVQGELSKKVLKKLIFVFGRGALPPWPHYQGLAQDPAGA